MQHNAPPYFFKITLLLPILRKKQVIISNIRFTNQKVAYNIKIVYTFDFYTYNREVIHAAV